MSLVAVDARAKLALRVATASLKLHVGLLQMVVHVKTGGHPRVQLVRARAVASLGTTVFTAGTTSTIALKILTMMMTTTCATNVASAQILSTGTSATVTVDGLGPIAKLILTSAKSRLAQIVGPATILTAATSASIVVLASMVRIAKLKSAQVKPVQITEAAITLMAVTSVTVMLDTAVRIAKLMFAQK